LSAGYSTSSAVWTHFTYPFQHAGIIHLAINSIALIGMIRAFRKSGVQQHVVFLMAYAVAVSASFIPVCISDRPTVGASGAVYALCGMYIAKAVSCRIGRKIKQQGNLRYFLAMLAVTLTVSFFRVNSAFFLHLFSLFIGIIIFSINLAAIKAVQ
jgi:membrane associated rhomboid family serine protease